MLKNLYYKITGDPNEKEIKALEPLVQKINALESAFEKLSDDELKAKTDEFRARFHEAVDEERQAFADLRKHWLDEADDKERKSLELQVTAHQKKLLDHEQATLDELLPEAFAAVREASKRANHQRHFDVQLMAGIVLHDGKIAEMKTGEGKTLVATLPLYLNALAGRGAHLVTPNDYLSRVGAGWMGGVYLRLGLSTAVISHEFAGIYNPNFNDPNPHGDDRLNHFIPVARREAYHADILYGTNNEFGFDYLRDNMVVDLSQMVQRELHYAIVDEVDNILIDEARTPLIIAGPAEESSREYQHFASLMPRLIPDEDYTIDHKLRVVSPTESGIEKVERALGIPPNKSLYDADYSELTSYFDNALKAHALFKLDKDYVVRDGEVVIVDEFTGRLMFGRRYSEGLHQAIEAKEGVKVQRESLTLATITFQNYFRMYHKLAGMTGTAKTEEEEFGKIYALDVVVIPTNCPMIREDDSDVIYKNEESKYKAVVQEIKEMNEAGRPVLVGTTSVEHSEMLAKMLDRKGVKHEVLNAKNHEKEATIIAQAGKPGAVTVATNMAGRGVDILLGGNAEGIAREELRKKGVDLAKPIEPELWNDAYTRALAQTEKEKEKVVELGGLHVVGTERHEARRIDNQLRGRAGRQGDPGSSRFYVSLEDEIMRRMGNKGLLERVWQDDEMVIDLPLVAKAIEQSQIKMEGYNFDLRKHLLEYDDVINKQREVIYGQRHKILESSNLRPLVLDMLHDEIASLVSTLAAGNYLARNRADEEWDLPALANEIRKMFPLPNEAPTEWETMTPPQIEDQLYALVEREYAEKEAQQGEGESRLLERLVMLDAIDKLWVRHLTALDELRGGIGLRAIAQQDPLVTFKREAFGMFEQLTGEIKNAITHTIFHAQLQRVPQRRSRPMQETREHDEQTRKAAPQKKTFLKVGRNERCPCGSGKKFKNCHQGRENELLAMLGSAQGKR
ncbi:MAG: preprotein translocase subunit SecA [Chloroflexi bacterium]|nr:preprotein translocase subunit SecA [Chloroflexota bacterium]